MKLISRVTMMVILAAGIGLTGCDTSADKGSTAPKNPSTAPANAPAQPPEAPPLPAPPK